MGLIHGLVVHGGPCARCRALCSLRGGMLSAGSVRSVQGPYALRRVRSWSAQGQGRMLIIPSPIFL